MAYPLLLIVAVEITPVAIPSAIKIPVEVIREVIVPEIRRVEVPVEVERIVRIEDMGKLRDLNREIRKLKQDKKMLKLLAGCLVLIVFIVGAV